MSRTAQGLALAGGVALLLLVLFAWPGGAATGRGPRTCLSIGVPVGGGGPVGCLTAGPRPPPTTTRPPPPPTVPPPVPPPAVPPPVPAARPPALLPAVVVPVTAVPTTSPPRPRTAPPPTTVPATLPASALPAPIGIAAERDLERRWALTAVILLIGGGAVAGRMRSRNRSG